MAARVTGIPELMLGPTFSFPERASVVAGPLAPLAASLAADLDRFLPDEDFFIPPEKSRLTRKGGRCERDGAFLEFDPSSPRQHRCPTCGTVFDADEHYRWWIMGYQLWLSERAVHAAALGRLTSNARYRGLSETILTRLGERYTRYPNEDNVLGPGRVFFSTYLESIWLLQLSVAALLLDDDEGSAAVDRFRDAIAEPSGALISEFNEGLSNRQVWNSAALAATAQVLDRPGQLEESVEGRGGLREFLESGLLSDGSWYEGENYHLFAHRGLWYLVRFADQSGIAVPDELRRRFDEGFVAPLRTALPDFTFPARRDSQYKASLRQWRIAESLELGLARRPESAELAAGLAVLYRSGPEGDAARWRSTGEAERNVPGVRLTRADLGWKSLLFARPELPAGQPRSVGSALMEGQGFAVVRRNRGQTYVALDYGHTGGSHGHPDRLNLWLVLGEERVFEDVGTGSYVEKTLHWYRSTLAHNAPLVNGKSQTPNEGRLRAWDEQGEFAWIDAEAEIAPGVVARRSVVVGPEHIVDRLEWKAQRAIVFDLPVHIEGRPVSYDWRAGTLTGGGDLEDGFDFLRDAQVTPTTGEMLESEAVIGAILFDPADTPRVPNELWRAMAPGAPGGPPQPFYLVRMRGESGRILSVWSWKRSRSFTVHQPASNAMQFRSEETDITYRFEDDQCHVQSPTEKLTLDGRRRAPKDSMHADRTPTQPTPIGIPLFKGPIDSVGDLSSSGRGRPFELGESHYRRTDSRWDEAGALEARVVVAASPDELFVEVNVFKPDPWFAERCDENPLDNEHPDINSDGVQIHLSTGPDHSASWLLVPERAANTVRTTARGDEPSIPMIATWKPTGHGWQLLARIDRSALGATFGLDVIVNEMPSHRERRRGQLVMSATSPGWAYLRGDRQDIDQLIPMTIENV